MEHTENEQQTQSSSKFPLGLDSQGSDIIMLIYTWSLWLANKD